MNTKTLLTATVSILALTTSSAMSETLLYSENFDSEASNIDAGTTPEVNVGGEDRDLQSTGVSQFVTSGAWSISSPGVGQNGLRYGAGPGYNWATGANAAAILADGGFSVSYDWDENGAAIGDNWVALKIHSGSTAEENGGINAADVDFGTILRTNGDIQTFDNGSFDNYSTTLSGTTREVKYQYAFSSFAAGASVDFALLVDGDSIATDTFTWDTANDVRVMLSGNYSGALIDNVQVSTIPEPNSLALLGLSGLMMTRRRRGL